MLIYHFINTPAGEFKSEKIIEMSPEYLRDQAFFLHREEQVIYRDPVLTQLYGYRDKFCFPTLSFIYLFNSIFSFPPDKYSESHIPLIGTSRYPITFTTETYCYTQPIVSTMQFDQQSLNAENIEFAPITVSFPLPLPSSPSNSSNVFREYLCISHRIELRNIVRNVAYVNYSTQFVHVSPAEYR
ncbi:unnamed protein product [Cercopithifilaria johnstoni]|uniref:Uncharacterized protein n=1 Tax=Cercopithifilaria johnstoni TaxID=2874296 RepID=A0A8J2M0S1_9BILA|nr:unnamed protein product [Cercopithifilaria johnstoni]